MAASIRLSEASGRLWERTPPSTPLSPLLLLHPAPKHRFLCASFSPAADWLALSDSKGTLFQVHLLKNSYKAVARGCNGVTALCILPSDPEEIAVACSSACVFVYQTTGRLQGTLKAHRSAVFHLSSARGLLLTCSEDACVLWRQDWSRVRSLFGERNGFVWADFVQGGRSIVTVHRAGEVFQWSLQTFALERQYQSSDLYQAFSVLTTGTEYLIGASKERITVWGLEAAEPLYSLGVDREIRALAGMNGKVGVLGQTGGVHIVDLRTKETVQVPGLADFQPVGLFTDPKGLKMLLLDGNGAASVLTGLISSQSTPSPRPYSASKPVPSPTPSDTDVNLLSSQDKLELTQLTPSEFHLQDLKSLLKKYGEFPDKYRVAIWQSILQLPLNEPEYTALASKGLHPVCTSLSEQYPIRDKALFSRMQRTLSALSHWSPVFAEADSVPSTIFPLVSLCGGQELVSFELIACLYLNWLQHWFVYYPNPPVDYLNTCETLLSRIDPQLVSHFSAIGSVAGKLIWPILRSFLTEILTKEEWLVMMDHLVANWDHPELLMYFLVQYLASYRATLMTIRNLDDLNYFLHKQNPANVVKTMRKAEALMRKSDLNKDLQVQFLRRTPLPAGKYPLFTAYPQFEVQLKADIRQRVQEEAAESLRRQGYLDDLTSHLTELESKEKQYRAQQTALSQLEQDRRQTEAVIAATTLAERKKLDQESRSKRLNQLKQLQETIENSLDSQLTARKTELARLEQEIAHRRAQDQYFIDKKIQDEAISRLEFQSAQKLYELTRSRSAEDEQRRLRDQIEAWKREQELRERLLGEQWTLEDEERRLKLEAVKERKMKEMEALTLANDRKKLEMQQTLQELEREVRTQGVIRERKLRTIREEEALRTAQALDQLTQAQTVLQQEEQAHFRALLAEERRLAERRARERLDLLEIERRKQVTDMRELEGEIQSLQKRQQRVEVEDKLAELRHEQELKALQEERQTQEMMLRIEEERRIKRELELEMGQKEEELREKAEFQQVLRETEERLLRDERIRFESQRKELRLQQNEEEAAKASAHNIKMSTIIRERERQLLELTQSRRQNEEERTRSAQFSRVEEGRSRERAGVEEEKAPVLGKNRSWELEETESRSESEEKASEEAENSRKLHLFEGKPRPISATRPIAATRPLRTRFEGSKSREEEYRPDLSHDSFSVNDELRFERASRDTPAATSPPPRSLSPGEAGEQVISQHDTAHRSNYRHASSPGSYSDSSYCDSESSQGSYTSGTSGGVPPLPERYVYGSSEGSSRTGSVSGSVSGSGSGSWERSERQSGGEVRRSHYY